MAVKQPPAPLAARSIEESVGAASGWLTAEAMALPGSGEVLSLTLPPVIARLREEALRRQHRGIGGVPALPLIDANTWEQRAEGEDWLIWRARRTRARLETMPIELTPGERIVGRPELREPTAAEAHAIADAQPTLDTIPPYPGGDKGHFHPDYDKLFRVGIGGIANEIRERSNRATDEAARTFYAACEIAIEGLSVYARRVAEACERLAEDPDESEASRWRSLAADCRRIAHEPPATFHQALQLMFLTMIALWFGEDHYLTTPGRMDRTLRPFYEADLAAGRLTRAEALELIACLYIQTNMILYAGSAESVMVGGRDAEGHDVTHELTYLCLAARQATRLVYPTVGLAWHEGTPPELTDIACQMIRTGIGDPAFFNDALIAQGLRDHGVSRADAHNYMNSTCVEIKVVGASNMWVTAPYFNCPQALLDVLEACEGDNAPPATFEQLSARVKARLAALVQEAAVKLDDTWHARAERGCFPLASCLIADCLERGLDFDRGGARYNWVENSFVGLGNLVDGLLAIKRLVYESGELTLGEMVQVVREDFAGNEALRQRILQRIPNYGNDEAEADALAVEWAAFLSETTASNVVGLHPYVPGFFCWVMHERMGAQTGATPDGRRAGFPFADGAGAVQGREAHGPTASVISTTKWSHREALGGLVHNVKLSTKVLADASGMAALRALIETYLRRGGFEIQVNVVSADTLRAAQAHPEQYADLLVRVAGYSDYFVHLNPNMQAEVIARTEHQFG